MTNLPLTPTTLAHYVALVRADLTERLPTCARIEVDEHGSTAIVWGVLPVASKKEVAVGVRVEVDSDGDAGFLPLDHLMQPMVPKGGSADFEYGLHFQASNHASDGLWAEVQAAAQEALATALEVFGPCVSAPGGRHFRASLFADEDTGMAWQVVADDYEFPGAIGSVDVTLEEAADGNKLTRGQRAHVLGLAWDAFAFREGGVERWAAEAIEDAQARRVEAAALELCA